MKPTTRFIQYVLILVLILCSCSNSGIKRIPVAIGETPATAANAIVGTWQAKNFTISSKGSVSGQIEINLSRSITFPQYQDVLIIQATAYYVWPQYGDWMSKPAGEFIPVKASRSTDTSITFDIKGNFDVPALKIDTDGGMPLDYLQVTMVWYRLAQVSENGYGGFPAKIGTPDNFGDRPWHGMPIVDQTVSLNGTVDTNVPGGLDYHKWFAENIHFPANPPVTYSSPLETPLPFSSPLKPAAP
jgi:hypothetical protein